MIANKSLLEMLESSFDGVWITDGEGKVVFANSANAALLGVSIEDLLGKTTEQLREENIISESVVLHVLETKKQASRVCHNFRTGIVVLATATPIFGNDGNIEYVFNNVRDISTLNELQKVVENKDKIIKNQEKLLSEMRERYSISEMVVSSKEFTKVVDLAHRVAAFDGSTVLILGESGTGKEIISQFIVKNSERKNKPYIRVNCGAIPANLIESELFGYEKGSFTGADNKGKKGLFEAADGGTIFLDEISELPFNVQVKLLRVLQEKEIMRIGSTKSIKLDVRVIAATNKNLEKMVKNATFREDLYYRLNVVSVKIPPLRERKDDIIPLIHHFLSVFNKKYSTAKTFRSDTISLFTNYFWPGNVRELENLVENLIITSTEDVISREDLPDKLYTRQDNDILAIDEIMPIRQAVAQVEADLIKKAMRKYGSTRKAAAVLGINASTIVRKMQSLNVKLDDNANEDE